MTKIDSKIPEGPVAEKWTNYKAHQKLVNPANKRRLDIIVVGTGLAGASAAASLGEMGFRVFNFCIQDSPRRAHSIAAQGGINAAKNYQNDGDSVYRLFYDTVKGGDYRAREANVYRLAEVSNNIIDQCVAQGVPFAREYGGLLDNRSFGGAQVSRTFYAKGQTGQQLLLGAYSALSRQVNVGTVKLYTRYEMEDVVIIDGRARGIIAKNLVTGKLERFAAHAVVIATGGYGNAYFLSTNAMACNCSAAMACYRKGAWFANPAYVQIHPTCIPVHGDKQSKLTLMSESLRNDGRIWVPKKLEDAKKLQEGTLQGKDIPEEDRDYYLERRYPAFGNLVPRDVASRAAKERCDKGYGVNNTGLAVFLDFSEAINRLGKDVVAQRYGNLFDMYEEITDVSPYENPMMIYPAIHYTMGGIWVDYELMTSIKGLFAIGPAIMMKFVCLLTKKYEIPTDVSLNTIMVDGTGMCGACRITIGGKTKFVCVDGPEFDGHQVDFDEMLKRMGAFKNIEREEMHKLEEPQTCQATGENMEDEKSRNAAWRQELRKSMKAKERTAIPRVEMNELDAEYRSHSRKEEVNQGLTEEQALTEAKRCLDCANPGCTEGCPVGIDIPRFIKNIERGEFLEAAKTLKETSALPAVCGRVCPQEKQCESKCIHLKMNEKPVAIGYLERFAADYERESGQISVPEIKEKNGIKVAVIGSGPAGLSFAGDMAKYGYDVTVFEALHEIGGVLKYGIPEFRLPNKVVDVEIDNLAKMGVEFVKDCIIGKTLSVEQLEEEGFKGIFVASGAGLPNFMNIPGENSINILSSNEYLTRVNLMDAASEDSDTPVPFGKCVAVIGGGNTAMDSVRTARRLGAERAMIIYRRSEEEMPARIEEVKHAKEEGVEFLTLHNPIEYIADEQGKVKQVVLQKMELGEPDASGRRSPVPIPGATETIDIDLAIVSVGVSPNPIVPSSIKGLELGRKGTIAVNDNMQSSIPTIFAGGDIVRGGATVILAMGDGRKAAAAMNEQLKK